MTKQTTKPKTGKPENAAAKDTAKAEIPAFLQNYCRTYPNERVFHVTSDRQVFLGKDLHFARLHQNSLGKGELTTYNI